MNETGETDAIETRGRGRRPDPAKDQAIIEAARALFIEKGYGASIDEIAERAGVVKQTIYARFKSKDALFAACIRAGAENIVAPLLEDMPGRSTRETLAEFARQFRQVVAEPENLRFLRLLIAQVDQFPELARRFYETAPNYVFERLSAWLASKAASGELAIDNPELAASQFIGLIKGAEHLGALLGVSEAESELQRRKRIDATVDAFLKLYAR